MSGPPNTACIALLLLLLLLSLCRSVLLVKCRRWCRVPCLAGYVWCELSAGQYCADRGTYPRALSALLCVRPSPVGS